MIRKVSHVCGIEVIVYEHKHLFIEHILLYEHNGIGHKL